MKVVLFECRERLGWPTRVKIGRKENSWQFIVAGNPGVPIAYCPWCKAQLSLTDDRFS